MCVMKHTSHVHHAEFFLCGCACTHRRRLSDRFTGRASFRFFSSFRSQSLLSQSTVQRRVRDVCTFFFDEPQHKSCGFAVVDTSTRPAPHNIRLESAVFSFRRTQRTLKDFEHDTTTERRTRASHTATSITRGLPPPPTCFSTKLLDPQHPIHFSARLRTTTRALHTHTRLLSRPADSGSRCIKISVCAHIRSRGAKRKEEEKEASGRSRS